MYVIETFSNFTSDNKIKIILLFFLRNTEHNKIAHVYSIPTWLHKIVRT